MRPRSKSPPQTPAERQAKCRAIKRGEWHYCQDVSVPHPPGLPIPTNPNLLPDVIAEKQALALSGPAKSQPALPAPPAPQSPPANAGTAIQKTISFDSKSLALWDGGESGDAPRLGLPPAVATRLRSLLDKHKAGKTLTAAERAEAEGLLDIAEYFVVQRLRRSLAA